MMSTFQGLALETKNNAAQGKQAEQIARDYLKRSGYEVEEGKRGIWTPDGYRYPDIIARRGGRTYACEVKSGFAAYGGRQLTKDIYLTQTQDYSWMHIQIQAPLGPC